MVLNRTQSEEGNPFLVERVEQSVVQDLPGVRHMGSHLVHLPLRSCLRLIINKL
jgi:hypothetical protein